jgi:hypothetical protein
MQKVDGPTKTAAAPSLIRRALSRISWRFRRLCPALTKEQADLLAEIKFPCC